MIPGYPDTVRHCIVGGEKGDLSWCGVPVGRQRGHFISAQHALLSDGAENKLCPDCAEAMKIQLEKVAYEQKNMKATDRVERHDREPAPPGQEYRPPSSPEPRQRRAPAGRVPPTLENYGADTP